MYQNELQLLSGINFKIKYEHTKFYKLTNKLECHNNFQYQDGLNVDILPFNPTGSCLPGGLYFTEENNIAYWVTYLDDITYIREVEIPDDALVYIEANKFKTNKIILKGRNLLVDFPLWNDYSFCLLSVQINGLALKYIKEQTPEICMAAVQQTAYALQYANEQTDEICMIAVQQDGYLLYYVKKQTNEICMAAVLQDGLALKYVNKQTPEIYMAAM